MALISKFCFLCSTRLGSIIIGVLTLVQACILLGVTLGVDLLSTVSTMLDTLHLEGHFYKEIVKNPKLLITVSSTFFCCLICSSILFIYGCFQCKTFLMYPFVLLYLLYIIILFVALLLLILYVKVQGNGLGDLILYSNLGGFILLFYLYTYVCVISLIQIISELQNRLKKKLQVVENLKKTNKIKYNKNNTKGFHNYAQFN